MKQLTVAEAKENFDRCLAEVRAGEEIILTDGGLAVARLAPERLSEAGKRVLTREQERAWQEALELMRQGADLGGVEFDRNEAHER